MLLKVLLFRRGASSLRSICSVPAGSLSLNSIRYLPSEPPTPGPRGQSDSQIDLNTLISIDKFEMSSPGFWQRITGEPEAFRGWSSEAKIIERVPKKGLKNVVERRSVRQI